MNRNRGFTLIELLVVIAIIGLLAAVVVGSVSTARSKGIDSAVKSNLDSIRAQAELYATTHNNSYAPTGANDVCTASAANSGLTNILIGAASPTGATVVAAGAAGGAGKVACDSTGTTWVVQAPLSKNYWCADYTGLATTSTTALGASATACPAS